MSDHERIWLEPECCACPDTGRLWCQDKVWPSGECKVEPTEYVLAAALSAAEARVAKAHNYVAALSRMIFALLRGNEIPHPEVQHHHEMAVDIKAREARLREALTDIAVNGRGEEARRAQDALATGEQG
jgi:hypothetical protein